MTRRASIVGWAAAAVLAGAGCSAAQQYAQSYLRKPTPGGMQSPLRRAIEARIDEAIAAIESAWARRVGEGADADAREEERRRLRLAELQGFQPGVCTARGPGASAAVAESDARERKADAAFAEGDPARAAALLGDLHEELVDDLGDEDPETARVANRLAVALLAAGDASTAMRAALPALEARKRIAQAEERKRDAARIVGASLDAAESEATVAQIYRAAGAFDRAREGSRRALETRARLLGTDHLCVAQSRNDLGEVEYLAGAYPAALELLQAALAQRERQLPADHRDVAQSLVNLGSLHRAVASYDRARVYHERALAIRRKLGESDPAVADSYHQLAAVERATGDLPEAEALYEKALAIRRARPAEGLEVASTETALAELLFACGDYARAGGLLEHALAMRRARLPADHPDVAESLAGLARLHQARLEFAAAEQAQREALAIWEKRLGAEHPVVAYAAASLGELYLAQGRLEDAEKCLVRAQRIREKKLGPDHPATAESLHQLGMLHYARADYARAEPLFRAAVDVRARALGPSHPDLSASLSYLGALLVATGRADEAIDVFRRAQRISEALVRSVGAVATEARFEALLRLLRAEEEVVYSLLQDEATAARAAPLALSMALLRKGRSVDEAASISRAVYHGLGEEERRRFDELRTLRAQIARQRLSPLDAAEPVQAEPLAERAERLEGELARHSAALRARHDFPTLDDVVQRVATALPGRTALVEVVSYRGYRFRAGPSEPRWGAQRYAAMVLRRDGTIAVADLGEAVPIDDGVKRFLKAVTRRVDPEARADAEAALKGVGRELDALTMARVHRSLGGATGVVLSLDGQLNLLPFGALHDGERYLADRWEITYVTSGRDLLPRPPLQRSHDVALFARPEFLKGAVWTASDRSVQGERDIEIETVEVREEPAPVRPRTRIAPGALRLSAPPSPLPGTEQEARAIQKLFPGARLVLGPDATKDQFLAVRAPAIVHVATHGVFRPDAAPGARDARGLAFAGGLLSPMALAASRREPLLNSMLLWANVGTVVSTGAGAAVVLEPSGLATALEVAGMDLWGTQLVVLSACETGRGHVDDLGQGVYGLRRAVMVAGAETLVTSLWKVDDEVTRELMTAYYRRLLAGEGRGEALRQASLAVRKRYPEPRYWAPFIAVGQVGPLGGLR